MFAKMHQKAPNVRLDVLRRLPIFERFSDAELTEIDALLCQTAIAPGGTMTTQGKAGREAFIVVSGTADVVVDGETVAHVSAGDVVGEMALLENKPRSATVVATTSLEVLVIDPRQFASLFSDPRTARWIATNLSHRLRDLEKPAADDAPVLTR